MKFLIALSILMTTPVFAAEAVVPAEQMWMKDLEAGLDQKQQKAMALISLVANKLNHSTDENRRDEAEYAQTGFTARLQNIREDRAELAQKDIKLDYANQQIYSKRLDVLISDLQSFLK